MKGLLLKDLYTLGNYKKTFLLQFGIVILFSVIFRGSFSYMAVMMVIMASTAVSGSFGYDESAQWDRYAIALPVRRKTIVNAKYLFSAICLGAVGLGSLAVAGGIGLASGNNDALVTALASVGSVLVMSILSLAISLPVAFRLGAEKARNASTLAYMVIFAAFMLALYLGKDGLNHWLAALDVPLVLGLCAAFLVVLILGSYLLSQRFYAQRDF